MLSGPSGVGKGTVVAELRRGHPRVWVSVSVTTRPSRLGERDGEAYRFVTEAEFDRMVADGELLEHATFAGHRYGTPERPVRDQLATGRPVLLEIDLQGARQVRLRVPDALFVFLAPPSWAELERRLRGRASEDPADLDRRLRAARGELAAAAEFDVVVVNSTVRQAVRRLVACMGV